MIFLPASKNGFGVKILILNDEKPLILDFLFKITKFIGNSHTSYNIPAWNDFQKNHSIDQIFINLLFSSLLNFVHQQPDMCNVDTRNFISDKTDN